MPQQADAPVVIIGAGLAGKGIIEFYAPVSGITAGDGLHLAGQTTLPGYGVPLVMLSGIQAADGVVQALVMGMN